ncbi:hypothetical protein MO973_33645 [Paenibacillus sp. TRM 82003]|nr:hypothetical protein [Paenibacillus sp. TRM 82003]
MERIEELEKQIAELKALVAEGPSPEWAAPTVEKLTKAGLLADPNGSRDFHRTLVVLDRAGAFEEVK